MSVGLKRARIMVSAAFAKGRAGDFHPLSVVVLDAGGHVVVFEREDGSSTMRFQSAHGKAHGALAMGVGSRALMKRAEKQP